MVPISEQNSLKLSTADLGPVSAVMILGVMWIDFDKEDLKYLRGSAWNC